MKATGMSAATARQKLATALRDADIETADLDARLLLQAVTGLDATALARAPERQLSDAELARLADYQSQRLARRPTSKIIGGKEFWGRVFRVTDDVLDPRPDSETLIAAALDKLPVGFDGSIVDLGTGSGCLLVTLLAERPASNGFGVDESSEALAVAQDNARLFQLDGRAQFIKGDWLAPVRGRHALIVANPPYVTTQEMAELAPEVCDYDPHGALHGGVDGLDPYRHICAQASAHLHIDGWLMFEIGHRQAEAVRALMAAQGFVDIACLTDLAGRDRVVLGRMPDADCAEK
jgi:release factor glutamine methyltransferase